MFTYGTLTNDSIRSAVLNRVTSSIRAKLNNYEVVKHSYANYPTIKYKLGSITDGILFPVNEYDILKLDRYENSLYDRIDVMINKTQCMVYIEKPQITMTKRGQLIQDHLNDPSNLFEFKSNEDELSWG